MILSSEKNKVVISLNVLRCWVRKPHFLIRYNVLPSAHKDFWTPSEDLAKIRLQKVVCMANPALSEKFFNRVSSYAGESKMTISGAVNKTGLLLLLMVGGAILGWNTGSPVIMIGSIVVALIAAMVVIFSPQRAPYWSPIYAVAEGLALGAISASYTYRYPGIVSNALMLTIGCLGIMLALYRFKIIQVTDRLRTILMTATMAIALTYLISMVMGFFGTQMPMIHQSSPVGIAFSVIVVGVAAFNLLIDFDLIEKLDQRGAPKFMEWYAAFALILTLVWLYMEILRLLSKLNRR